MSNSTQALCIWILEDDPSCIFVFDEILSPIYKTKKFEKISDLFAALQRPHENGEKPELLIADLTLTDGNFLERLGSKEFDEHLTIPFMVVSSSDDLNTLRACFDEGALDYLTKPFKKAELQAKVEHAFNKSKALKPSNSPLSGRIRDYLTKKEFDILETFLKHPDYIASRQQLEESLWKGVTVHPKALDVHMYNLRKKLTDLNIKINLLGKGQWQISGDGMKSLLN